MSARRPETLENRLKALEYIAVADMDSCG